MKTLARKILQTSLDIASILGKNTVRLGAARDTYEIPAASLNIILESQFGPPAPPDSMRAKSCLNQDKYQPWPFFHLHIPGARLVGKSLAVMNGRKELLWDSVFRPTDNDRSDPSFRYYFLPRPLTLTGSWTSIVSRWTNTRNYAEWCFCALPRLACLNFFPSDTQILIPNNPSKYQVDSLTMLGIFDRCRPTWEPHLLIENYYHASQPAMCGCHNPYAVKFLRQSFCPAASLSAPNKKIYISRKKAANRPPLNELALENILTDHGWQIICSEDFSFAEQIQLFHQATAICAPHGAGLANMIWSRPGCKILELFSSNFLNGSLEALAVSAGHEHRHLIFPADRHYRMTIDPLAVRDTLQEMGCF